MCAISIDVGAKRGIGAAHRKPVFLSKYLRISMSVTS